MKRFVLPLLLLVPVSASAIGVGLGKGYSVDISTSLDLDTVAAYDFKNGEWLTGVAKDVLSLNKSGNKIAYLSGEQLFNLSQANKGSFGMALGVMTGTLTQLGYSLTKRLIPDVNMPQWMVVGGQWVSIEGGGGYRMMGNPQGENPWVWTVGGKVKIPLDDLKKLFTKSEPPAI